MVGFVLQHACKETFARVFHRLTVTIHARYFCVFGSRRGVEQLRYRQTTFSRLLECLSPGFNDRVDDVTFTAFEMKHEDCLVDPNLGCGQPDPVDGVHGFVHRVDESLETSGAESSRCNLGGIAAQDRVWNSSNW